MVGQARGRRTSKMRLWQRPRRRQQAELPGQREQEQNARGPTRIRGPAGQRRREVRGALLQEVSTRGAGACAEETGMTAWGNNACYLGITENTHVIAHIWTVLCMALAIASHCQHSPMGNIVILRLQIRKPRLNKYRRCALIVRRWKNPASAQDY